MKHKTTWSLMPVALAACLACAAAPAHADTTQDLLNELRALKARVGELEKKLEAQTARQASKEASPPAEAPAPGMTPDQLQDFNRIAVKTEALEDSRDMLGFKGLKVSGYMDPTFVFNQRQHQAGFQFLNSVGDGGYTYDNSYIGSAAIDFIKETEGGSRWRLTLSPQRSTQAVSEGSASILHEASVSIPLTDLQTRFIAGHIPDWSGYEYLQPTLNKLITHNLLFDLTLPSAYTGAGMEITRNKWIVKGVVELTPEVVGQRDSRVDLFEFDAYFIRGDWTVQGQASWGRQHKASITPAEDGSLRNAIWTGLSGLVAYKFEPRLEGVIRLDRIFNSKNGGGLLTYSAFDDHNGIGPAQVDADGDGNIDNPNKGVDRTALTLGMNYAFNLSTVFKVEYRYDWASGPVFLDTKSNTYKKNNQLLSTAVVVSF